MTDLKRLLLKCGSVLGSNWNGSLIIPSSMLYPHKWSWDSAKLPKKIILGQIK